MPAFKSKVLILELLRLMKLALSSIMIKKTNGSTKEMRNGIGVLTTLLRQIISIIHLEIFKKSKTKKPET